MKITNPPKALIALVGLVCLTLLMALNSIEEATGTGLIGSILGYAIGNGVAARKGDTVSPIFGRRPDVE